MGSERWVVEDACDLPSEGGNLRFYPPRLLMRRKASYEPRISRKLLALLSAFDHPRLCSVNVSPRPVVLLYVSSIVACGLFGDV